MMTPTAWAARWVMEDPQPRDFLVLDGDVLTALLLCGAALWFLIVWATASVRRFEATSMGTADAIDALPLRERSVRITSILRRAGGIARKRIRWAKALVVVLPMLGLWGAVDGLIRSFSSMAVCTVHPEAPTFFGLHAHGIDEAVLTVGLGILLSVPAFWAIRKLDHLLLEIQDRLHARFSD